MKKLFISLLAVAALASCAKEDVIVADPGELIAFNSFVENSTRATAATDPSYSTTGKGVALKKFNVYGAVEGVNIFNGNNVTKGDDVAYGDAWACDGAKQYWIADADYVFDAVVDATTVVTDENTGLPVTLTYDVTTQKDMLHDRVTTVGKPTTNDGLVAFEFNHLLSKVKFSVENTSDAKATNYRIVVTDAKLTNVYPSGTYAVTNGTWTPDTATYYALEDLTVLSAKTEFNSKEVLLIPGSAVGVYVKAEIQVTADGTNWTKVAEVEKPFDNALGKTGDTPNVLVANNAYHFAVKLGIGTEIQFTATQMPDWTENDPITLQ